MSEGEKPERVIELAEQLLREKQAEAALLADAGQDEEARE